MGRGEASKIWGEERRVRYGERRGKEDMARGEASKIWGEERRVRYGERRGE